MTHFARISLLALLFAAPLSPLLAENWPRFRGPSGQGVSTETNLPLKWAEAGNTAENIAWKTPIPGLAWSSPIVWGERIFLTTATDQDTACHVLCIDRKSGKVLWDKEVFKQNIRRRERLNSGATATPVTDGTLVYALFCDGSIAALDFDGKPVWINRDIQFYSRHGMAVSPILYEDLLIVQVDHSTTDMTQERMGWQLPWDKSYILALDKKTGKERWKGMRGISKIGHSTPNVMIVAGKPQLISATGDVIQGFDPADGRRLWSVPAPGEPCVPSIVIGDELVYAFSGLGGPAIRAVRPGRAAEDAKLAWEQKEPGYLSSFIYARPHLFAIKPNGIAMCYDAATGKVIWTQRLQGGNFSASPILAQGRIYALSETGECTIFEAGPEYREIAKNRIDGGKCAASFAASEGRLYLRTETALYCIGK